MSILPKIPAIVCACFAVLSCSHENPETVFHSRQHHSFIDHQDTLCLIGDPGTGDHTQYAVAAALETAGCSQIRILGDVIYPSGIESADDPLLNSRLLQPYQYFLQKQIPVYLLLGNHDHKKNASAWLDVASGNPLIHFPNYYYSENWNGICFFSLDTSYYEKVYFLHKRSTQTNWLRQALADQSRRCEFSIGLGHHPYKSSGSHGDAQWQLGWFFEEELIGKIDLYISGHDHHLSDEGVVDGTRLLISGSAGLVYKLKTRSPDHRFSVSKPGFITLKFSRKTGQETIATYTVYTLKPDGSGGYTDLKIAWQDQWVGRGIR